MDKTKLAVDLFDTHAELYQQKYMNVSLYADSFNLFCANLNQDATVLELACGPGNITRYLSNKRPDLKILATDLAPKMLELARINNPEASVEMLDCRNILALESKYNAIMCGFCLPYLSKEEALQLIEDASKILLPEGILYLSTMEDEYSKSRMQKGSSGAELFMHFHEADYLNTGLVKAGLKIIDTQRKVYLTADGSTTTDLIIIAQK